MEEADDDTAHNHNTAHVTVAYFIYSASLSVYATALPPLTTSTLN